MEFMIIIRKTLYHGIRNKTPPLKDPKFPNSLRGVSKFFACGAIGLGGFRNFSPAAQFGLGGFQNFSPAAQFDLGGFKISAANMLKFD